MAHMLRVFGFILLPTCYGSYTIFKLVLEFIFLINFSILMKKMSVYFTSNHKL